MIIVKIGQTKIMPNRNLSGRLWWYENGEFLRRLASFSDDVTFGISGTFSSYTNDVEKEAWNSAND
jgi:hypothetical protein